MQSRLHSPASLLPAASLAVNLVSSFGCKLLCLEWDFPYYCMSWPSTVQSHFLIGTLLQLLEIPRYSTVALMVSHFRRYIFYSVNFRAHPLAEYATFNKIFRNIFIICPFLSSVRINSRKDRECNVIFPLLLFVQMPSTATNTSHSKLNPFSGMRHI